MTAQQVCFFCRARPAHPDRAAIVRAQRRTPQQGAELIENREVEVPRCRVCEQTELLRWLITGGILAVLFGVAVVTRQGPPLVFAMSMAVVLIGGLAFYSAWRNRRGIKRSMGDVREYPEVTDLLRDGYRVLKSGPWDLFDRVMGRR